VRGVSSIDVKKAKTVGVYCFKDDEEIGFAKCTIRIKKKVDSSESFQAANTQQVLEPAPKKKLCFLSFCL
jgi:hypothetical protein